MKAKVFATGHLGKDAETKVLSENRALYSFSMATSNTYMKDNEKKTSTDWHEVRIFTKEISDGFLNLLKKGAKVSLEGNLAYNEWEKDGVKRKDAYIDVNIGDIDITPVKNTEE